ncbi:MAG: response regulator transcription factor [Chloroflexi bacterium]|nr:response regulator transcription factor [Chloroflexota bacterium]
MTSIRLLIVDGATLFREGLCAVLETQDQIVVVGDTGDAAAAVRMAAELQPDVILMDLQLPHGDGVAAIEQILAEQPTARIIALTTCDDATVTAAVAAGVQGYLLKSQRAADVAPAVKAVAAGGAVLDRGAARRAPLSALG